MKVFFVRQCAILTLSTQVFTINSSFPNTILLKTVYNRDRQRIFDKTAYVQNQDFTLALKIYTSSARDAHDIFYVCECARRKDQLMDNSFCSQKYL